MSIKETQNTWLVGRLTNIIKELSGPDVEVVYEESTTEMAYTTSTETWLTFKWANGKRRLLLYGDKARWNDDGKSARWNESKRTFNFSLSERVLRKIARDIIKYIEPKQQKGTK